MSYYRGDYYRGDYYRGGIGDFLRKAGKVAVGALGGFITGGPGGAIMGAVGGASKAQLPVQNPISEVIAAVGLPARLPAGILGTKAAMAGVISGSSVVYSGRRRRSMNHLNPKALTRATRRITGFVKKARKGVSPLGYTVVRRGSGGKRKKSR